MAVLQGTGGLRKLGAGTFTLSLDNPYTGDTTIGAGTLALSHASHNNVAASPNLSVASGAILDVMDLTDGELALASGQSLNGSGTLIGTLGGADRGRRIPRSQPGHPQHGVADLGAGRHLCMGNQ